MCTFCLHWSFITPYHVCYLKACEKMGFCASLFWLPGRRGHWTFGCTCLPHTSPTWCSFLSHQWIFKVSFGHHNLILPKSNGVNQQLKHYIYFAGLCNRFLRLLADYDWMFYPLIVDINNDFGRNDEKEINVSHIFLIMGLMLRWIC